MRVVLSGGERLYVRMDGADGEFIIDFDEKRVMILADYPDDQGKEGILYRLEFVDPAKECGELSAEKELV